MVKIYVFETLFGLFLEDWHTGMLWNKIQNNPYGFI